MATIARSFSKVSLCLQDRRPELTPVIIFKAPNHLTTLPSMSLCLGLWIDGPGFREPLYSHLYSSTVYLECLPRFPLTPIPIFYLNAQSRTSSHPIVAYSVYYHSTTALRLFVSPTPCSYGTGLSLTYLYFMCMTILAVCTQIQHLYTWHSEGQKRVLDSWN